MSKKIKVLSVGHSYVVAMNRAILREVAEDPEFEVTVGAPQKFHGSLRPLDMEPEPESSSLNLEPISCYLTQKMHLFQWNPWQLNKLFKQGFDCAHFWEEPYVFGGFQLARMAQKQNLPYLFRTAQSLIKKYPQPFQYFEKSTYQGATRFVAGGHLVLKAMRDKGWQKQGEVITLAVDTKAFKPWSDQQKKDKRQAMGLQGPVIGYLGRLSEEKGCDLFMEALTAIKDKPWSFLAMGSGPYKDKIEKWAKNEGLEGRVQVTLLKHDEVPKVLPVCDLLICPSQTRRFWKEQFGRMIVEAFACGVPVMGSDSGEIPRVIDEAGVVLPEADPQAWIEALRAFVEDPKTFEGYIQKGFKRVELYTAKAIADQYKEVYRQMALGK